MKKRFELWLHNTSLLAKSSTIPDGRNRKLALICYVSVVLAVFFSIFGQFPFFTSKGLTPIFHLFWILTFIPMLMLDYRHLIRCFVNSFLLVFPFLIYCIVAVSVGINSFDFGSTRNIFLCGILLIQGQFLGKYFSSQIFKSVSLAFVVMSFLYATYVFFNILRGYDLESPIYAFNDKNSAGPIFFIAALLTLYVFNKKNALHRIIKFGLFIYFSFIITISKCRATIIFIPLALILIHLLLPKKLKTKIISTISIVVIMCLGFAVLYAVPILREKILFNIVFNSKKTISEAFSGRLEQIINVFKDFHYVLGNGGKYIDCMPISLLSSYGIVGTITILPMFIIPIYTIFKARKLLKNHYLFGIEVLVLFLLLENSLFEGYGLFGPGTKTFILWLFSGYSFFVIVDNNLKEKVCNTIEKPSLYCAKIKPKYFLLTLQFILLGCSAGALLNKNTPYNLGAYTASVFREKPVYGKFNPLKKITIYRPELPRDPNKDYVFIACKGQKIKFSAIPNPINADECYINWCSGWYESSAINVENYSGIVEFKKAIKGVTILQAYSSISSTTSVYAQIKIKDKNEFNFNNLYIDSKKIETSFDVAEETKKSELTINLQVGETTRLYFDENYLPIDDKLTFEFTKDDPDNTISIDKDTGVIIANSVGQNPAVINGIIKYNGNKVNNARNSIKIKVNNAKIQKQNVCDKVIVDTSKECYQYQPYEVSALLINSNNEMSFDQGYDVQVSKLKHTINEKTITFKEYGNTEITVIPRSNPSAKVTFPIYVNENKPTGFTCDTTWMKIGETKNSSELGLKLNFENGYKKIVEESDLDHSDYYSTYTGIRNKRAHYRKSGFVGNGITEIASIADGTFSYSFVSSIDKNIKTTISITTNVRSYAEYVQYRIDLGFPLLTIAISLTPLLLLFVVINKKRNLILISLVCVGTVTSILFLIYPISVYTISCATTYASVTLIALLIRLTRLHNKNLQLIDKE